MDYHPDMCKNGSQKPRALAATPQETEPWAQHFCHNQMRGKILPDTKVSKPWPPTPTPEGRGVGSRTWGLKTGRGSQDNQGWPVQEAARGLERDLHPREKPYGQRLWGQVKDRSTEKTKQKMEQLLILQKRNV